jgi:hypothetical protein
LRGEVFLLSGEPGVRVLPDKELELPKEPKFAGMGRELKPVFRLLFGKFKGILLIILSFSIFHYNIYIIAYKFGN